MDEYEKLEEELKKVYEVIMLLLIVGMKKCWYEKLEEELKKVYEVIMLLLIVGKFVTLK